MRRHIWTAAGAAVLGFATTVVMAQTPATPPQSPSSTEHQRITVVGCLKEAPPTPADEANAGTTGTAGATGTTGTTGTTGATGTPGNVATQKFVLTNATPSPGATAGAAGTSGTSGTAGTSGTTGTSGTSATTGTTSADAAAAQTYRLIANPASLSPHVGKKLELTGTLERPTGSTTGASAGADEATAAMLRVESGRVLAASCEPEK